MPETFIRPDLAQKIQQAAVERSMDMETEAAMQTYLRQLEQDEPQKNIATFERLLPTLQQKYGNEYIAISNDAVVDHDQSFQAIHHRIRERFGHQPVLIRQANAGERILDFRSTQTQP